MCLQRKLKSGVMASAALLMAALLPGCSSLGSETPGASLSDTAANLLAFNKTTAPAMPAAAKEVVEVDCPTVEVQDGTASLRTYAGAESNSNVRYQYSLGDTARECNVVGNQIAIKVGIEGRVLIGPTGTPGSFSAPVRIAIRHESEGKAIVSKLYHVPVTVPPGADGAPFSFVSEPLLVPMVNVRADEDYTILVGFDAKGGDEVAVRHKKKHS